jgi:glycosyltransferase involved in cell wall biosynthesis
MAFQRARWKLRESIRELMLRVPEDHLLRRAYGVVRRLPFVRAAWRSLGGHETWRDVERYAAAGGTFAGSDAPGDGAPSHTFGDDAYFQNLIDRIHASPLPCEPVKGRIVLVNNGLSAGGAERQIVYTLTGLKARGHDVRFIGEFMGRAPGLDFHTPVLTDAGIIIEEVSRETGPGPSLYANVTRPVAEVLAAAPASFMLQVLDMAATLRRLRPEVVHLWQDETSTKYGFAALIAGVPKIILSGRNLNPTHFEFHQPYMRAAYLALLSTPGVLLSNNTRAGARSYAQWLGVAAESIRVIYNGFDFSRFERSAGATRAATRERYGIDLSARLILGVFRLSPEKRPGLWIDAALTALDQDPQLAFVIAGTGPMEAELKARVEVSGFSSRIRIIGEVSDVGSLYAAADLFFLASSEEGAPNVLIEAQWAGLPCVATDAGGVAETVQDGVTAIVAQDATVANLATALLTALDDKDFGKQALGQGPAFVSERFGAARMIDDTIEMYGMVPR